MAAERAILLQGNNRAMEGELGRLFFALRRFSGSASSIGKAALIDIDYHPRTGVQSLPTLQQSTSDVAQGCFEGAMGSLAGYWVPADHFTPPHSGRVGAGARAVAFPPTQAPTSSLNSNWSSLFCRPPPLHPLCLVHTFAFELSMRRTRVRRLVSIITTYASAPASPL